MYICREIVCKDDFKNKLEINIKYDYLKGDLSNIIQEYSDKGGKY